MVNTIVACGPLGPRKSVTKSLSSGSIGVAGDILEFEVVVHNVGDVDLTGVTVADSLSPITAVSDPDSLLGAGATIVVGGSSTVTYSYTLTAADEAAGFVANTATASSNEAHSVGARAYVTSDTEVITQTGEICTSGNGNPVEVKAIACTNCSDPTITAFVIELRDNPGGTLIETFTEASTTSATTGVTYIPPVGGGLPQIQLDETAITTSYDLVFVSYTTACGTVILAETLTVLMEGAVATSACHTDFNCVHAYGIGTADYLYWIDDEGNVRGFASNTDANGSPGTNQSYPHPDGLLFATGISGSILQNLREFYPGETWTDIAFNQVNGSLGYAINSSGTLVNWGNSVAFTVGDFAAATGRPSGTPYDGNDAIVPFEIPSPNGLAWKWVDTDGTMTYAMTVDGTWFSWGREQEGQHGLAHVPGVSTTTIETNIPTPVVTPIQIADRKDAVRVFQTYTRWIGVDGNLYVNGSSTDGRNGGTSAGGTPNVASTLVPLPAGVTVDQFQVSTNHTLVLGTDGVLYYMGSLAGTAPNGTLPGSGGTGLSFSPIPNQPTTFVSIGVSPNVNYAVGSDGLLYTWTSTIDPTPVNTPENTGVTEVWVVPNGSLGTTSTVMFKRDDDTIWVYEVVTNDPVNNLIFSNTFGWTSGRGVIEWNPQYGVQPGPFSCSQMP